MNEPEKLWCPYFNLCKLGKDCSISADKATKEDENEIGHIYCMTLPPNCFNIKEEYRWQLE